MAIHMYKNQMRQEDLVELQMKIILVKMKLKLNRNNKKKKKRMVKKW